MAEKRDITSPNRLHRRLHWWHLGALVILVAGVEAGTGVLSGLAAADVLSGLPHALYGWCPVLAGVAISIRRADRGSPRGALKLGAVVVMLMVILDLLSSLSSPVREPTAARTSQGYSVGLDVDTGASWILTGVQWARGDLTGTEETLELNRRYPGLPARLRAGEAIEAASAVLLVFATLGLVLTTGRWIRGHVSFEDMEDERGAHLVVAWLLSPVVVGVALSASDQIRTAALFGEAPLWAIPIPSLAILAIGLYAWMSVARHPHDDESRESAGS